MIFGHLAVAAITKRRFFGESFIFLLVASYGPDIIDKSARVLFGLPNRWVGHTLIVWLGITVVLWFLSRRFDHTMRLLYLGSALWLLHLASDLLEPSMLFWPWLGPMPESDSYSIIENLYQLYILRSYQIQFYLDVSCIVLATTIWISFVIRKKSGVLALANRLSK
jgi:hypothetical protein